MTNETTMLECVNCETPVTPDAQMALQALDATLSQALAGVDETRPFWEALADCPFMDTVNVYPDRATQIDARNNLVYCPACMAVVYSYGISTLAAQAPTS